MLNDNRNEGWLSWIETWEAECWKEMIDNPSRESRAGEDEVWRDGWWQIREELCDEKEEEDKEDEDNDDEGVGGGAGVGEGCERPGLSILLFICGVYKNTLHPNFRS